MTDEAPRKNAVGRLTFATVTPPEATTQETCPPSQLLAAFVDGVLFHTDRDAVERHLASCDRCRAEIAPRTGQTQSPRAPRPTVTRRHARWLVPALTGIVALVGWIALRPAPSPRSDTRARDTTRSASPSRRSEPATSAIPPAPTENAGPENSAPPKPPAQLPSAPSRATANPANDALDRPAQSATPPAASLTAKRGATNTPQPDRASAAAAPDVVTRRPATLPRGTLEIVSPNMASRWRVNGGLIAYSSDGGVTWGRQRIGTAGALVAGASPGADVCWLVGKNGTVLLSTGGQTWRQLAFPEAVDLVAVRPADAVMATITTADNRQLTTRDGGATWDTN